MNVESRLLQRAAFDLMWKDKWGFSVRENFGFCYPEHGQHEKITPNAGERPLWFSRESEREKASIRTLFPQRTDERQPPIRESGAEFHRALRDTRPMRTAINLQGCQLLFCYFFLFGKEKSS